MTQKLFILAYDGCQLLDVSGPAAVFGAANEWAGKPFYDVQIVSADGGLVGSNCGVALQSKKIGGQPDTLLVAGGSRGLKMAMAHGGIARWLRRVAPRTDRYGSVCTGAFVLASAGLLDGKVWTSAGVTTGIDMALALVEADLGAAAANLIARHFVLYARRPGYQSQFSPMLQAQATADAPFAALIDWMQDHLDRELDVPTLARHAGYSERSFYRKFTEATGKTPAHFVEDLRLDAARTLLSKGLSLKTIAGRVGLKSSARLGQAFERRFGMAPSQFRQMHASPEMRMPSGASYLPDRELPARS